MICPACAYERQSTDTAYPGICPACGIAYIKWQEAREDERKARIAAEARAPAAPREWQPHEPFWLRLYRYACFMPSDRHESAFWGHGVLYLVFLVWGWRFILHGVDWTFTGSSFLHLVNLPFHEYGHVVFSPFGNFWMFLGGSLFQILLPLLPLAVFMVWQRDNFPASLMLWWCGQNFIDVAPYIADAPVRAIPLTSRHADSHDWWNLLTMAGSLELAGFYANLCFGIGAVVLVVSNLWGAHLLWIEFQGRTRPALPPET